MIRISISAFVLLGSVLFFSCEKDQQDDVEFTIYKTSGDLSAKMTEFRNQLGTLNTTPGATGGRREINWDGVPDSLLNRALPKNFFNPVGTNAAPSLQRGLTYDEGEFQVSATRFAGINSEAASEFSPFSGDRVFANVNNNLWPIGFQVAGKSEAASVRAFGMVFSDVDLENSTSLEFFDGEESLGNFFVPPHTVTGNFSFLGVIFHNRNISQIKVHHQGKLGEGQKDISQGGTKDLIVLDDMIYSEPFKR